MRCLRVPIAAAAAAAGLGCAVSNYPVIRDAAGPWDDQVTDSFYDKAYIVPTAQVATLWSDGSEETFTEVSQDWMGDQRLETYVNFDPTASVIFLDQTYCDPARKVNCAVWSSWNPDLPDRYPISPTGQSGDPSPHDDPFDGVADVNCPGYRSFCVLLSMESRIGECGSGFWSDKQSLFDELARLTRSSWRGRQVYRLILEDSNLSIELRGVDGTVSRMPIAGVYKGYIDENLRVVFEVTPNTKYQVQWLERWTDLHGADAVATVTYGSLSADWQVRFLPLQKVLDRF
ncbi:MAG: hypothetical protein D6718_01660 [Acidobacteria bacterium]|nr:MAG: hypothetical protein D6718_01660 [Acidobacteriota bacterium]